MRVTLYKDEEVEFLCDYLFNCTKVALHLNITPGAWSPQRFKKYNSIFLNKIVPFLKAGNYNEIYATPFKNDTKAQKLIKMFGLHEFGQKAGFTLMKREI